MTKATEEYYKDLGHVQNHPCHAHVDIMTITGMGMGDAAKIKHLLDTARVAKDQEIIEKWTNRTSI